MKSFEQLAKAAYATYCKEAARRDDEGLAGFAYEWHELDEAGRQCWIAVAMKVVEEVAAVH